METTDLHPGDYVLFERGTMELYAARLIDNDDLFIVREVFPETNECTLELQSLNPVRRRETGYNQRYSMESLIKLDITPKYKLGEKVHILEKDLLPPVDYGEAVNMVDAMYDEADRIVTIREVCAIRDDHHGEWSSDCTFAYLMQESDWLWREDDMLEPADSTNEKSASNRAIEYMFDALIGR